jgi:hypothetical protein
VQLEADKVFDVWTGSSQKRDLVCVPKTPAKFVYQISKQGSNEEVAQCLSRGHPLSFVVSYRMMEKGYAVLFSG